MPKRRVITNSTRRTFTRCRRQHWFRHEEKLEPILRAPPLAFGSLIHDCLQSFYKDKIVLHGTTIAAWRQKYIEEVQAANDVGETFGADVDTEKVDKMAELATGIMDGYVQRYAVDHNRFEVIATELPFKLPLHVPCSSCEGSGSILRDDGTLERCPSCGGRGIGRRSPTWDYAGVLDLVVRELKNGLIWVVEHKTTATSDRDQYESDLQLDTQPRGYVWAALQLAEQHGWGTVGGILYNCLRKKIPAEPKPTQCKRCRGTGKRKDGPCQYCNETGVGAISKSQGTDTTMDLYANAIKAYPHLKIEDYEDVLQKLRARGDRFFWRFYHHINDGDLIDWELEMYQVTRDIATTDRYYRNPDACSVNGRRCPFRRICLEDDEIARKNFNVRSEAIPEITQADLDAVGGE